MNQKQAIFAGVLAAIGASLCCVAPLFFVSLGLGGAWLASLTALEPLRPLFILLTLACIGLAFYKLYLDPKECNPEMVCVDEDTQRRQRRIFWLITLSLLVLLAFPWIAPLFY